MSQVGLIKGKEFDGPDMVIFQGDCNGQWQLGTGAICDFWF
jgi:hypothetical protein